MTLLTNTRQLRQPGPGCPSDGGSPPVIQPSFLELVPSLLPSLMFFSPQHPTDLPTIIMATTKLRASKMAKLPEHLQELVNSLKSEDFQQLRAAILP